MNIFIGADEAVLSGKIAKRFGQASFYLIYNTNNKNIKVIMNDPDDAKHQLLEDMVNDGVETFIVGNIGPDAFNILQSRNAKVFLARKMTAQEAIDKLFKNELEQMREPTVKRSFHQH